MPPRFGTSRPASPQDGSETRDVARLLNYLLLVANDFGTISARFEQSAFGFGRTNPFEIRVETDAAGNLLVRSADRLRPFFKQGNQFVGVDDDRGQIAARPGGGWLLTESSGTIQAFRPDGLWEYTQDARGQRLTASYDGQRLVAFTNAYGDHHDDPVRHQRPDHRHHQPRGRVHHLRLRHGPPAANLRHLAAGWNHHLHLQPGHDRPHGLHGRQHRTADGVTWNYGYDAFGRLSRTSRNGGQLPLEVRHGTGEQIGQITLIDPAGAVTTLTRGEFGQPGSITDPSGASIDYQYDRQGRLIAATGAEGTVYFTRNAQGRITAILSPAGVEFQAAYDTGNPLPASVADPLGRITSFSYDSTGLPASWTQPDGSVTSYEVDSFGRLAAVTNTAGSEARRTYDSRGLLTRVDYADGSRIDYTLDTRRRVTRIVETLAGGRSQTIAFDYDAGGRISALTDANGRVITYEYDPQGRLFRTTADGVAVETTFDDLSTASTIRRDGVLEVSYAYDAAGNLASKTYANGTRTSYQYDLSGRTTRVEHRSGRDSFSTSRPTHATAWAVLRA